MGAKPFHTLSVQRCLHWSTLRSCLILFSLDAVELPVPCKWPRRVTRLTRHLLRRVGLFIHPEHTRASPLTQVAWCKGSLYPVHLPTEKNPNIGSTIPLSTTVLRNDLSLMTRGTFPVKRCKKRMKGSMYEYKSIHLHIHSWLSVATPSPSSTSSGSRSNPWLLEF